MSPGKKTFYIYLLTLISVPLMVTPYTGNPFYFTKNSLIMIFGGIFIISALFLIFRYSQKKEFKSFDLFIDSRFDPGVIFFFFALIISTIFSININVSYTGTYLRPIGFEILVYIFLIYFLSAPFLANPNRRMLTLYALEITADIISLYAVLQFFQMDPFGFQWAQTFRPVSTVGNSVFLGGILLLVFPFSVYRLLERKKINITILSPLLIIYTIIISQTRTAYVALIVETGIILFLYPLINSQIQKSLFQKLKFSMLIFSGILLVITSLILIFPHNVFALRVLNILDFNNARWLLWRDSLSIFKKFPFSGCGLGTFPIAFEDVYTMQFKIRDVGGNYDNAHSNYLHTLCTMGIIGLTAYLFLIIRSSYLVFKSVFSDIHKLSRKLFYLCAISMFAGYIIFSIADFDDISVVLFLFAYLSVIRSGYVEDYKIKVLRVFGKLNNNFPPGFKIILFISSVFICYNIYISFIRLEADKDFGIAYALESRNLYQPSLDYYTSAVNLCGNNSYFKFRFGCTLFDYSLYGGNLNSSVKRNLLEKSKSVLIQATETYPFKKDCLLLVTIINYELGDTIEANKMKNDLLQRDSFFVSFRIALAQYYIYKKDFESALDQTLFVCKYDPANDHLNEMITLLLNNKESPDPVIYCRKILSINPRNEAAISFFNSYQKH